MGIPAERIEGCGKEALQCQATLQCARKEKKQFKTVQNSE